MSDWHPFAAELSFRRFDLASSAGPLETMHRPTVVEVRGPLLLALSISTDVPPEGATARLQGLATELGEATTVGEPSTILSTLRDEVWRRFQAGAFDRGLPDVMAVVVDTSQRLRVWRAGPNGAAWIDEHGVRLVSEDLRFAAVERQGAQLEARWTEDPLLAELSELTQIEPPHAAAQEFSLESGTGSLLLLSRGALPFAVPPTPESIESWWERDAGWRHGLGATGIAIAGTAHRARADAAFEVWAIQHAIETAEDDDDLDAIEQALAELHHAGRELLDASSSKRADVAAELSRQGGEAWNLLAAFAQNPALRPEIRLAASSALTEHMPRASLEAVAMSLLSDNDPELRAQGIVLCARLYLDALEPLVRHAFDDHTSVQIGDRKVSLGHLARAASHVLLTGRPNRDFPEASAVAANAPPAAGEDEVPEDISLEYLAARQWLLRLAPEAIGWSRPTFDRNVFGVLMETGYPQGTHTLACLLNGDVHNHLSNGILDSDMGGHPPVRTAGKAFLARAQIDWEAATPTRRCSRPTAGSVRFYFLGAYEIRVYEANERGLMDHIDPLAELYHAGHAVLSEIHAIELGLQH